MKQTHANKNIEHVSHDTVHVTYIVHILCINSIKEIDLRHDINRLKGNIDCQIGYC